MDCGIWRKGKYCKVRTELLHGIGFHKKILNKLREDDLYVRAKRARIEGPPDKFQAAKDYAISSVRSIIRNSLSYGRSEARKHILEGFMFVVDKVKTFDTLAEAKEAGFDVEFVQEESEIESIVPADVTGTIWDIGDCETMGGTDSDFHTANNLKLEEVAGNFPSLFLSLTWQRRIVADDSVSELPEDVQTYYKEKKDVSLHEIALKILTSMSLAAKDTKLVMTSSRLTLKAVHVLAIGLRGVVRQCLGQDPTPIERSAMGSMTADGLGEDLDIAVVSTKLGKRTSRDAGTSKAVDTILSEKFTIKLSEYTAKRRLNQISSRSAGSSSRRGHELNEQEEFEQDEGDKSDIDEPFLV